MQNIPDIISDMKYGRETLLNSIEGLSHRELTQVEIYPGWTIKDILAHLIGWDQRVIKNLKLIAQNRASEIPRIDVEGQNHEALVEWRDNTFAEVLAAVQDSYRQIIEIIAATDYHEIDRRHERNGRFITIRSYVIENMVEHERQHAAEIALWRKKLPEHIDSEAIKQALYDSRREFMKVIDKVSEHSALEKGAVGEWSISDLVGHVADWEARALRAALHIYDPSLPAVPPVSNTSLEWNRVMASHRSSRSWTENHRDLITTQAATDNFLKRLTPRDWALRGPYPWPNDQGTLAELIVRMTEHYMSHLTNLTQRDTTEHSPLP